MILSQAVGKPVRVQWMRQDDFQWSTQSPAAFSEVQIGLDAKGKITAFQIDHYMPAMQDDRLVGAILAGLPTIPAPNEKGAIFGIAMMRMTHGFTTARRPCWSGLTARSRSGRTRRRSASDYVITACVHQGSFSKTSRASWPSQRRRCLPESTRFSFGFNTRMRNGLSQYSKPLEMHRDGNLARSRQPLRMV